MDFLNGFGFSDSNRVEDNYEIRVNYQNKFGKFDLNAFVGGIITNFNWYGNSAQMDVFGKLGKLIIPDVWDFKNADIAPTPNPYSYKKTTRSLYGTFSLGYNDLVYIDGSLRNDINSAYFNKNNSFGTFSLGTSILLHNFIEKNNILTFFKVRAGIAQIAADISATALNPEYRYNTQPFKLGTKSYIIATQPTRYVDPELEPAINQNFELGADLKFINNRISLSATYYNEKRNDEPIPVTVPSSSGMLDMYMNSADAVRKGIELSLSSDVFKSETGVNWTTSINFAKNKSTVTHIAEGLDAINYGFAPSFGYVSVIQKEGMEWGQLVGNGYKLDASGNKVLNADGLYVVEQNKYFGSVLPKFTGGFYNTISYKGVTLSAAIDFQKGGKFFSLSEQWGNSGGLLDATAAINDRGFNVRDDVSIGGGVHVKGVSEAGAPIDTYVDGHTYFTQFHANRLAEEYVHDASYVKLRELALSYSLPKSVIGSKFQGITVGLVARNPWLIWVSKDNHHKFDPSEMSQPYGEDGQLPSTRGFGVNVKINF